MSKRKVIVYRVECPEGKGPYTGPAWREGWALSPHNDSYHPTPSEENIDGSYNLFCGFESMQALARWFHHVELCNLEAIGLQVSRYEVSEAHVKRGKRQLCFDKDRARFLGAMRPVRVVQLLGRVSA